MTNNKAKVITLGILSGICIVSGAVGMVMGIAGTGWLVVAGLLLAGAASES